MDDDTAHTDHPLRHFDRTCPACRIGSLLDLLESVRDAVEALDGTSVENERIVDNYRETMTAYGRN